MIGWLCSTRERYDNSYTIFVGKAEGKRLLGISRHRWQDNIRMDLRGKGWKSMS